MNGVIVADKPGGFTSFDVVAVMRKICGEKKIGHTGTLDPMATGVLPLLLGTATRAAPFLEDTEKEYEAAFRFGYATDTQDSTGRVTARGGARVTEERLLEALGRFRGEILQTPPMYSAVRVGGRRLYELARQGVEVERKARKVTIYRIRLLGFEEAEQSGRLFAACSKGTYIRTLCADLGQALGTYGVLTSLRRTRAAGFTLNDAVTLEKVEDLKKEGRLPECLRPVECLFPSKPKIRISAAQAKRFRNGGALDLGRTALSGNPAPEGARFRVCSPEGEFLGLGEKRDGKLHVLRLFCPV